MSTPVERRLDEFRVVYLGVPAVVDVLRDDFLRAGARVLNEAESNALTLGPALLKRMSSALPGQPSIPGATVHFHTDVFAVARVMPQLDADLLIVDERLQTPAHRRRNTSRTPSGEMPQEAGNRDPMLNEALVLKSARSGIASEPAEWPSPVTFEELQKALHKFTPREFHYPSKRILVVLPEAAQVSNRPFYLGLANVRGVMIEPANSVDLFFFATRQLQEFRAKQTKTSICISGGGLEGYIYAIGVCQALDDCFAAKDCTEFDIYCGVSSGAILGASLAMGVSTGDLLMQLYKRHGRLEPLTLNVVFDVAGIEILGRIVDVLRGVTLLDPGEVVARLQRLVPVGFFRGERIKAFIERQLKRLGVTDNLTALKKELYISVTDQDTGEHIVFGEEPWKDIRISQAVRASTALPPFYLPERINGHWFTDGQLTSSSDFNTAIQKGAGLVLLIDPMVAYSSNSPGAVLKHGGYFTAVQAIKSLVQTRSSSMLKHAMDINPDVDFIVFKPTDEVMEAMAGNPMRYRIRTELAELGYRGTLGQILAQYDAMAHKFAKHRFELRPRSEIEALLH